jgi:hypothetical protein
MKEKKNKMTIYDAIEICNKYHFGKPKWDVLDEVIDQAHIIVLKYAEKNVPRRE